MSLELLEVSTSKLFRAAEHNDKGLKAVAFTISEILHSIFWKQCFSLESGLSIIPRAPEIPTGKLSGVLNTMAKVWKL